MIFFFKKWLEDKIFLIDALNVAKSGIFTEKLISTIRRRIIESILGLLTTFKTHFRARERLVEVAELRNRPNSIENESEFINKYAEETNPGAKGHQHR